jgi:iron complex transport system substrate-binding protein
VDGAEPGEDLFPDRFAIAHAENLSLTYEGTYKVMTVAEPYPGAGEQAYVLAQCGTEPPPLEGDLAGATVVEVPVRSLYSQSQSHLGFVDELGIADVVTGVPDAEAVVTPGVRERVEAGEVVSFAAGGVADAEQVVAGAPDVLVTGGTEDPAHEAITAAGIPVLANAEWLEASPQGWAEWIAFFAALTNTEARATERFDALLARYDDAAARAAGVEDRPRVLTGGLFEGDWHARGGDGTVARFIADAGGDYVYADDPATGTLTLDIEEVLADARDADVWLSPSAGFTSRAEAEAADERYGQFAAWGAGGVWEADVAQRPGVDIFESGPVMIDEYLLDYIKVLHPDLAEDHDLVFFRRLPEA